MLQKLSWQNTLYWEVMPTGWTKISNKLKRNINPSFMSSTNWSAWSTLSSSTSKKETTNRLRSCNNNWNYHQIWENWRRISPRKGSKLKTIWVCNSWNRANINKHLRNIKICRLRPRNITNTVFRVFPLSMNCSEIWPPAKPNSTTTSKPWICSTPPKSGNWFARAKVPV